MSKAGASKTSDNPVARATMKALERVDAFLHGARLKPPEPRFLAACDGLLETQAASVFTGIFFFMFYWLEVPDWDLNSIPKGWRNQHYGDKFLCEQLTRRHIQLHGRIKAYGENIGSKGSQANFRPRTDHRYAPFLNAVADAPVQQRAKIADYLAQRFAESRRILSALPPVGPDVLTFVRAKKLFYTLIEVPSGGAIPQFLIAALLFVYRRRSSINVMTHQVHASDTSDRVAGDIEEYQEGNLWRAYEVTLRPEWMARMSGFRVKMDNFGLTKYVIIARNVNRDAEWAVPANMALKIEPYERDIAVIDVLDVLNFFAMELTPDELSEAVNRAFDYLNDLELCGRAAYIEAYRVVVHDWLQPSTTPGGGDGAEVEGEADGRAVPGPDGGQHETDAGDQGQGQQEH
jgi:hypothetical protein